MEPLASVLRPKTIEDYIGQEHLVGLGKPLRVAIEKKHSFSFILWGPPGVGKTTLARIYAKALNADYHELSAVSAGKDDIRRILEGGNLFGPKIIFLDEIHRFNKAQQDFLLPYVESGELILIGATTENPSFEVISALLSRARVFTLTAHTEESLRQVLMKSAVEMDTESQDWLISIAGGDARQMLTVLEYTLMLYGKVTLDNLKLAAEAQMLRYAKKGEDHYDVISAFIKSMRAGKKDAAMYYLARMIVSGEDPKFIARRMVVFASEDIGLADKGALIIANEVFRAVETVGLPEVGINLAHGASYLCEAKKDRSSYDAYNQAIQDVKVYGNLPVPLKLRNAPTKFMKESGYGDGYEMYGNDSYLPEKLDNEKYF